MDLKLNKKQRAIFLVHDHKESGNDKWVLDMMKAILKKVIYFYSNLFKLLCY